MGAGDAEPVLSIVVPVYNAERFLPDLFESLLGQTRTGFECVFVDDGSTDGSARLCDGFASRFSGATVVRQDNAGAFAARRAGAARSRGRFVSFLDSDDLLFRDSVERMLEPAERDADARVHVFSMVPFRGANPESPPVRESSGAETVGWEEAFRRLLRYRYPSSMCAKVWPADWLREAPRAARLRIGEDLYQTAWALLSSRGGSIVHPDVVYAYRQHPGSAMHRSDFGREYAALTDSITSLVRGFGLASRHEADLALFGAVNSFAAMWKENRLPPPSAIRGMLSSKDVLLGDPDFPVIDKRILSSFDRHPRLAGAWWGARLRFRRMLLRR